MAPSRGQGGQNYGKYRKMSNSTCSGAISRTHWSGTPERSIERIPVTVSSLLLLFVAAVVFVYFMSSFLIFCRRRPWGRGQRTAIRLRNKYNSQNKILNGKSSGRTYWFLIFNYGTLKNKLTSHMNFLKIKFSLFQGALHNLGRFWFFSLLLP